MSLPWCFKVVYGFVSDSFPIFGQRRKPYFVMGYCLYALCAACIAILETPTLQQLSVLLLVSTCGMIMADVMTDTMVVERAKMEPEAIRGTFQSNCYSVRFVGSITGSLAGSLIYNQKDFGWAMTFSQINALVACLPVIPLLITVPTLFDKSDEQPPSISAQLTVLWETVQLKAVWMPMSFIFFYNSMQWGNIAWSSYLQLTLKFT
jgi:MFS family permease